LMGTSLWLMIQECALWIEQRIAALSPFYFNLNLTVTVKMTPLGRPLMIMGS
jgi:hypothetical protein